MTEHYVELVKEYLRLHTIEGDCNCNRHRDWLDRTAKGLCQLFPKSADNPDGFEPDKKEDKKAGKLLMKDKVESPFDQLEVERRQGK